MTQSSKTCLWLLLWMPSLFFAQEKFTISGVITDQNTNETLIGVNILIPTLQTGTTTNEYGFYSITLPKGEYDIQISYLGYNSVVQKISLNQDVNSNFKLSESTESLDEIVITENIEKLNIKKPQMSVNSLSIKTIKQMPSVLGEVDVIKSITLLPGVSNAGEGSSGFNADQADTDHVPAVRQYGTYATSS